MPRPNTTPPATAIVVGWASTKAFPTEPTFANELPTAARDPLLLVLASVVTSAAMLLSPYHELFVKYYLA